jgi:hypothetical protein
MDEMEKVRAVVRDEEGGVRAAEALVGPTVAATLGALLARGGKSVDTAAKVVKAVGLGESTYWWIRAKAYIEARDLKGLEADCGKKAERAEALARLLEESGFSVEAKKYKGKGGK